MDKQSVSLLAFVVVRKWHAAMLAESSETDKGKRFAFRPPHDLLNAAY
jgi:hypothetical protein